MSKIEWTDKVWNPVTGCTRASAGCDNCYAVRMTKRLANLLDVKQPMDAPANIAARKYSGLVNEGKTHFNGVVKCHEDVLTKPLEWKKPCRVFVNSMSDLFHPGVPFEFIDKVFAIMALCPHITFQILTKRPERMLDYFRCSNSPILFSDWQQEILDKKFPPVQTETLCDGGESTRMIEIPGWWKLLDESTAFSSKPLPNVWLGTSVEDQNAANERIPYLLDCPAAVRFLSVEPQIGNITLHVTDDELGAQWNVLEMGIHWVIVGGESGSGARLFDPQWALDLKSQCEAANVPFFFKQMGSNPIGVQKLNSKGSDWVGFDELRIREFPR